MRYVDVRRVLILPQVTATDLRPVVTNQLPATLNLGSGKAPGSD